MSSFRYVAWIWHRDIESQRHCAQAISSRLQTSQASSWNVGLVREGLSVFYTGGHPGAVACYPLPNEAGVVLGTVFLRRAAGSGAASGSSAFTGDANQGEYILSSDGRWLIDACWGRYVALFCDAGGHSFRVLRDPSGSLSCLLTTFEGLTFVFSHPEDALRLGVLKPSINWR